jgi:Rod binding domain-containing protein
MLPIGTVTAVAGGAVQTGSLPTPPPRLVRAAHEFEAQMMKELLKPMTGGDGLTGEDEDAGSGASGALGEFASEALGRALSERGGLGIANSIVRDLSHSGNKAEGGQVTGKPHGNVVMKSFE